MFRFLRSPLEAWHFLHFPLRFYVQLLSFNSKRFRLKSLSTQRNKCAATTDELVHRNMLWPSENWMCYYLEISLMTDFFFGMSVLCIISEHIHIHVYWFYMITPRMLSRRAQSGRWSFYGKRVWFTKSHLVLIISFFICCFVYAIYFGYKIMQHYIQ